MSDKNKKIGLALTSIVSIFMLLVLIGYVMLIINEFEPIFDASWEKESATSTKARTSSTTSKIMPTKTTTANGGGNGGSGYGTTMNNPDRKTTTTEEALATSSGMKIV